jgi:cobalt-zinc-cadmium efflux system outer membrane protein
LEILPQVRPDLLALKAGYESQEARVRGAILAQFPSLGIGINRARDTSNVDTLGLSISLGLPLLSGNRGNIAIERATREQLYQEYSARLAQAWGEVDQLLELQSLLQAQQRDLADYVPRLEDLVGRAARAYHRGDIDALTFLNLESTWVNKRLEQITLLQSSWENRIALDALLALPWNPAAEGEVDAGGQRE